MRKLNSIRTVSICTLKLSAFTISLLLTVSCSHNAQRIKNDTKNTKTSTPIVLNNNGGWCWYQDERAIIVDGKLWFGSVANIQGDNGIDRSGNIEVVSYDLDGASKPQLTVLHDGLEDDDHNVPALIALPNDDVLAIYSKHNTDRYIRYRINTNVSHDSEWEPEVAMRRKDKITYANLLHLRKAEGLNNGNGELYNFYRGINFNPTFDVSYDLGQTWTKGQHFIKNKGRPYVKYASNSEDEIHFVTTEQHPRVFNNSIYHGVFKDGKVFTSDGRFIHNTADGPVDTEKLTKVFQGGPNKVAWTTDLHVDEQGNPYTVFSVQVNDGNKDRRKGLKHGDDMRYYFAKWHNSQWQVNEIAYAGSRLYDREQDYTGLAALNPLNPAQMVISSNANPATGEPLISSADGKRHWELFIGNTRDNGKTWTWEFLTRNSIVDNIRPVIPTFAETQTDKYAEDLIVLWMKGTYTTYTQMDTDIMYQINPPSKGLAD